MTRSINPVPQFFDSAGDPLIFGKMYFFESGTTTPKQTYADVNLSILNTHPVLLTADGRMPNVFFNGTARQVLTSGDDVQIWVRDPVSSDDAQGSFSDWNSISIYEEGDIVTHNGLYYISIQSANQDNDPSTSPEYWTEIRFLKIWNENETYSEGVIVQGPDNLLYRSLTNNNQGNNPISDSANWGPTSTGASNLVVASSAVFAYENFGGITNNG